MKVNMKSPVEARAWRQAVSIAEQVVRDYANNEPDPTSGALFYHATYVDPHWSDRQYMTASIGKHVFYSRAKIVASR